MGLQNVTIALSVILPAYLEEENLRILLPQICNSLNSMEISHEILVVDTMTPMDNTAAACQASAARYLNRLHGNTYGDAVRTGIQASNGNHLLFMDADGSHPPEWIPTLYARKKDADVIVASRYVAGGLMENTLILTLMSKVLNGVYRWVLGIPCADISNSFKLYLADQVKGLTLNAQNFDIIEELLFKLVRTYPGLTIIEVPFCFKRRLFGKTKRNLVLFILTYLYTLLKLRFGR